MAQGTRPEVNIHRFGVVMHGMKWLGARTLCELPNTMFGHTILVVGSHSTKADGLMRTIELSFEICRREDAIVCMAVLDGDAVGLGKAFEGALGLNRALGIGTLLKMCVGWARSMIDEHGGNMAAASGQSAFVLGKESSKRGFELVHGDAISRIDGRFDGGLLIAMLPLGAVLTAAETARAHG